MHFGIPNIFGISNKEKTEFTTMNYIGIPKIFGVLKSGLSGFTTENTFGTPKIFQYTEVSDCCDSSRLNYFGIPNQ